MYSQPNIFPCGVLSALCLQLQAGSHWARTLYTHSLFCAFSIAHIPTYFLIWLVYCLSPYINSGLLCSRMW